MGLRQYWPAHFVVEGEVLKINPEILTIVSGGSFINPITVTVTDAGNAGLNTLATLTARRTSPGTGFGESILFRLDDSLNIIADAAAMDALWESATSGFVSSAIAWRTRDTGTPLAERMRLTSKGALAIGTLSPDPSAKLQIDSTTRGIAPPRMSSTQRNAIASPLTGLIVYNLTTGKISQFNGTSWEDVGVTGLGAGDEAHFGIEPSVGTTFGAAGLYFRYNLSLYGRNEANNTSIPILTLDFSTATGNNFTLGNLTGNLTAKYQSGSRANSGKHTWQSGSSTILADLDDVRHGIKVPMYLTDGALADPAAAAILELNTTTKGLLLPRPTTTQRNAISTPPDGLIVYDSTLNKTYIRAGGAWVFIGDNPLNIGVAGSTTNYFGATAIGDYETIAGNVIADPTKTWHFVNSTADRAITLPAASGLYHVHVFQDITNSAGTHPSTFDVQSSGTIDGNSTAVIADNRYVRMFTKVSLSPAQWTLAG